MTSMPTIIATSGVLCKPEEVRLKKSAVRSSVFGGCLLQRRCGTVVVQQEILCRVIVQSSPGRRPYGPAKLRTAGVDFSDPAQLCLTVSWRTPGGWIMQRI